MFTTWLSQGICATRVIISRVDSYLLRSDLANKFSNYLMSEESILMSVLFSLNMPITASIYPTGRVIDRKKSFFVIYSHFKIKFYF